MTATEIQATFTKRNAKQPPEQVLTYRYYSSFFDDDTLEVQYKDSSYQWFSGDWANEMRAAIKAFWALKNKEQQEK